MLQQRMVPGVLGLLLVGLFLFHIRAVLIPFGYAIGLAYALAPILQQLRRRGFDNTSAILISYGILLLVLLVVLLCVIPYAIAQFEEVSDILPVYTVKLQNWFMRFQNNYLKTPMPATVRAIIDELITQMEMSLLSYARSMADLIIGLFSQLLSILIAPVLTFYMLRDSTNIKDSVRHFIPHQHRHAASSLLTRTDKILAGFVRGHLLVSLIVGLVVYMGLWLLKIDFAFVIAVVAGLFDIVPYFGPIIGAVPAVLMALTVSPVKVLWVLLLFVLIHQLESTIITPKLLGDRVGLHPLTVVFSVLAGGHLFGIAGLVLAAPVVAILKMIILCRDSSENIDTKAD